MFLSGDFPYLWAFSSPLTPSFIWTCSSCLLGKSLWLEGLLVSIIACQVSICFVDFSLNYYTLQEELHETVISGHTSKPYSLTHLTS